MKILIYGINGYIGQLLKIYFQEKHEVLESLQKKITLYKDITNDITRLKPDRIISAIGLTKCDGVNSTYVLNSLDKLYDNLNINLHIHNLIAKACKDYNVHFTYTSTGCLYTNNLTSSYKFTEDDEPNFTKSAYSTVKIFTEKTLMLTNDNILIIRLRQCLNNDKNDRNFLNKFLSFSSLSDIPNSFTVIPSMFPILVNMVEDEIKGLYNFVNKGGISPKEIVDLFTTKNYTISNRNYMLENYSNNILSVEKLEKIYEIDEIKDALLKILY